jgi:putative ABC transport system permease protein
MMAAEWMITVWLRIKSLLRRRQLDRDLREELSFHLAMRQEKYQSAGMTSKDAHAAARRRFGNLTEFKEACRQMWTFAFLETLWQDIRYGLRQLRRNPGFTAVAVIILALGIGANAAIFRLIDAVRLRTLPVKDPNTLAIIHLNRNHCCVGIHYGPYAEFTYPLWRQIRQRQKAFSSVAVWPQGILTWPRAAKWIMRMRFG